MIHSNIIRISNSRGGVMTFLNETTHGRHRGVHDGLRMVHLKNFVRMLLLPIIQISVMLQMVQQMMDTTFLGGRNTIYSSSSSSSSHHNHNSISVILTLAPMMPPLMINKINNHTKKNQYARVLEMSPFECMIPSSHQTNNSRLGNIKMIHPYIMIRLIMSLINSNFKWNLIKKI